MIIIPANTLSAAGGYDVANSCRFNDNDSASMSRTTETPTNVDKYTFSVWIKRGNLGIANCKILSIGSGTYGEEKLELKSDDLLWRRTDDDAGETDYERQTDRVFRDPSAWMHIFIAYDSSDGTAGDRMKIYINGVRETSFSGSINPDSNENALLNTASKTLYIGRYTGSDIQHYDGYMAELAFVDGVDHAVTDFGEFDEDSPTIWKPKDISSGITWGNNGFYLDFEDSSALGNDVSGNNNDFTTSGLAATDQSTDTCTNNFATLNPLNNYWAAATFSEGNSVYTSNNTGDYYGVSTSTIGVSSGKWYFEAKNSTDSSGQGILGITSRNQTGRSTWLGSTTQAYGYYASGGVIRSSASDTSYGATYTVNDIIGIYMDLDNNKMYVSDNGVLQNSGTGHTITAAASTDSGFYHFAVGDNSDNTQVWQCNFGGTSGFTVSSGNTDVNGYGNFEYDPSAGTFDGVSKDFLALCTKNLSEFG